MRIKFNKIYKEVHTIRSGSQYCGSEFFNPGSRVKKIPDPGSGSASKNVSIFNPKYLF
jgi:hypothetical protein